MGNAVRVLFILGLLVLYPGYANSIPAFPGAEGFGADSVGGRGGRVIKVTNLNDSGPWSLREAVEADGPRIVVFEVSGIIDLDSDLVISNPYITIAGQTSPGGILVTGRPTIINTHDVIIQHMRFRVGSHDVADAETHDTMGIVGNTDGYYPNDAYNIIIDHCSFSWGIDEVLSISLGAHDITIQWSIISEGLDKAGHPKGRHSKGLLVNTKVLSKGSPSTRVSIHHNYLAHNADRNPLISGNNEGFADVVNNVVYNFGGSLTMATQQNGGANWIHNYVRRGPDSNGFTDPSTHTVYEAIHYPQGLSPKPLIYVEGNIGVNRQDQTADEWSVGEEYRTTLLDEGFRKSTPWSAPEVTKHVMSDNIAGCILSAVGATAPVRDSVDTRVIDDFSKKTGAIRDNVTSPYDNNTDFPTFDKSLSPPEDNDNDGMADSWEVEKGLDPTVDDSSQDMDGDGYTNIEEYLHYLSIKSFPNDTNCMPDIFPPASPSLSVVSSTTQGSIGAPSGR